MGGGALRGRARVAGIRVGVRWTARRVAGTPPCAEAVTVSVGPEGEVEVIANTTSAGPGYHQYVCDFIDELAAQFRIRWEAPDEADQTGYFVSRDRVDLEERMLQWLGAVAERLVSHEGSGDSIAVSMSMDHQFDAGTAIVTPLGPRTREWAEATARAPESGSGFFAWWDEGDTGRTRRDRALARMWAALRWSEPRSEDEARLIALTLHDLGMALEKDPDLEMPWREWLELGALVGEEPRSRRLIEERASAAEGGSAHRVSAPAGAGGASRRMEHPNPGGLQRGL